MTTTMIVALRVLEMRLNQLTSCGLTIEAAVLVCWHLKAYV